MTHIHAKWPLHKKVNNAGGGRRENIAASVSGGRREMGASALRRDLKARVDSSNEIISSSNACKRWSRDSAKLVCMKVIARSE